MPSRPHVTPFPNVLLDTVMPLLKDTEWRVLCVIVRQTLGWQIGMGRESHERDRHERERKARDWLTHSQLKQRTGRNSAAISKAVDSLVQRGLIAVYNGHNRLLHTPQQRQRCHNRLYYGLSPTITAQLTEAPFYAPLTASPTVKRDPKSRAKFESQFSESKFRKAKTTKETYTKLIIGRAKRSCPQPVDKFGTRRGQWTQVGSSINYPNEVS